ncbi:MAG: methionyl-tRNA formyltransferase [Candidatus Peribacteraceae bacterium]
MSVSSVVFLGTSAFAVPALRALHADPRFRIDLVVTQPDKPVGRKQILTPSPIKVLAEELKLHVLQPEKISELPATRYPLPATPDFLIVISYGQILPQKLLDWPRIAPINVHGSLLPTLRGASPVHHAILQGLTETGVTVQRMVKALDAGPILASQAISIDTREKTTTLMEKLAEMGASLLLKTLSQSLNETPQDESAVTFCSKLKKEDGIVDPSQQDAQTIDRMVRALTPWPGVTIRGNKILETSLEQGADDLALTCANNTNVFIRSIQPPSGKPMTGKAFSLGRSL